jgi:site-specific DNA-methyltransferase (adenine-specific)
VAGHPRTELRVPDIPSPAEPRYLGNFTSALLGRFRSAFTYGDNLEILRHEIAAESVDLVYLDPPFNSQANYNVLFKAPSGEQARAQIEAFEDTWHWNETAERAFDEVLHGDNSAAAQMLHAMRSFLGENDMMAYLAMMAVRLIELHRVLKPTGSLYLHCDPKASHYLKILLDAVFGKRVFVNEIVWKRTTAHSSSKRYAPIHDIILYFNKSQVRTWNEPRIEYEEAYLDRYYKYDDGDGRLYWRADITGAGIRTGDSGLPWRGRDPSKINRHWALPEQVLADLIGSEESSKMTPQDKLDVLDANRLIYWPKGVGMPQYKRYRDQLKGRAVGDIWDDIDRINPVGGERLGYPTQKPVSLLERIVRASSNPGDVVLDPFCGCGTAVHAAQKLGREWIGIDVTHLAISLIEKRLTDAFPGITFEVHGTPKDLASARDLAFRDKYQFQWWAVSLVGAVPFGGKKKGADTGIDGIVWFKPDGRTSEKAIVSVKGGEKVGVGMIKDLIATVNREKAKIGLLVTLAEPGRPMRSEALTAGFYEPPMSEKVPKIQILTIQELIEQGRKPAIPLVDPSAFRRAAKEDQSLRKQATLL